GRFRSYLLTALKHFLANEWHRARTEKRGGRQTFIPLDEILAEERHHLEPADTMSADRIFERRWAWTLLEQVLARLGTEFAGNRQVFDRWKQSLAGDADHPTQGALASELGLSENA